MQFDFVFNKKELIKNQFFQWLIDAMVEKGWENLSANKTSVDNYTMFSTGESGTEKIGVQLRDYHLPSTSSKPASYNFSTTNYVYISARAFHSYTMNPNITTAGTVVPNGAFTNIRLTSDTYVPTDKLTVYYHINKDRVIVVVENNDSSTILSTCFFVIGKPYTLADYNEYCTSAVITSHGSSACRSGVVGYQAETTHLDSTFRVFMPTLRKLNSPFASDIVIDQSYEGIKYVVENILVSNYSTKLLVQDMRKNIFKDSEGRVFKQCINNNTSELLHASFRSLLIRIG